MYEVAALFIMMPLLFFVLFLLGWSLIWVYQDAEKRGKPGILVALLVFLLEWPISLLLWLVFRPESPDSR
jgi:hypothetical protein